MHAPNVKTDTVQGAATALLDLEQKDQGVLHQTPKYFGLSKFESRGSAVEGWIFKAIIGAFAVLGSITAWRQGLGCCPKTSFCGCRPLAIRFGVSSMVRWLLLGVGVSWCHRVEEPWVRFLRGQLDEKLPLPSDASNAPHKAQLV